MNHYYRIWGLKKLKIFSRYNVNVFNFFRHNQIQLNFLQLKENLDSIEWSSSFQVLLFQPFCIFLVKNINEYVLASNLNANMKYHFIWPNLKGETIFQILLTRLYPNSIQRFRFFAFKSSTSTSFAKLIEAQFPISTRF